MTKAELFRPPNYSAYVVRLWQESPDTLWRASAQCAGTGEKLYFATLAELFVFLEAQTVATTTIMPEPPAGLSSPVGDDGSPYR
jgi:hypothetical protein